MRSDDKRAPNITSLDEVRRQRGRPSPFMRQASAQAFAKDLAALASELRRPPTDRDKKHEPSAASRCRIRPHCRRVPKCKRCPRREGFVGR